MNALRQAGRNTRRAFTLIEALVILTILAILAALLFPAFFRVMEKSREVSCLSNLRTLGLASLNYFQDHDGRLFQHRFWYDSGIGMRDYVISANESTPGLQRDTVFTCKELKHLHPERYPQYLNRTYTLNWLAYENHPTTGEPKDERPKRLVNIPSLSRMWMLTDGSYGPGTLAYGVWLRRTEANPPELAFPHAGRQNTVFFDGHAEPVSRDDFYHPKSIREFWGEVTARD